jgi:heat-inducible transcriptional repressor
LIRLGSATLLLVVMESGRVEKRVVDLDPDLPDEEVERLSTELNRTARGRDIATACEDLSAKAAKDESRRAALTRIAEVLSAVEEAAEAEHVFVSGVANIAAEEAFRRRETLRHVYEALERESEVLRLLREAAAGGAMSVTIGHENRLPEMWEASVVASPYGAGAGTIGIVGPTRMDYASAMAAVRAVAERLSAAVEALS